MVNPGSIWRMSAEMWMPQALATVLATLIFSAPAVADSSLVTFKVLTLESALKAARAALDACRAGDFQVSVAVVDRFGVTQVILRDRFAGPHTPKSAHAKAWTAVSFRSDTSAMIEVTTAGTDQAGVRHIPGAIMVGGGKVIQAGGTMVGAIGVSGAPGGAPDDHCADVGIEAIADDIAFE
jgi:uncharacterized protein GlcG (DUF336 family)